MIIQTIYDYQVHPPKPLYSLLLDKSYYFLPLYAKGFGTSLRDVFDNLKTIENAMKTCDEVIMNDVISMCRHIDIDHNISGIIKECDRWGIPPQDCSKLSIQKTLLNNAINTQSIDCGPWTTIKGMASIVYSLLEKRGVRYGREIRHPLYDTKVFSGRSKSSSFNIQGTMKGDPVYHPDPECDYFVCFDWVSADLRMAGIFSNDEFINNSFIDSDPYTKMSDLLSTDELIITRDDCKQQFLHGFYSMNPNSPFMVLTEGLKQWMISKKDQYESDYAFTTYMGMPIPKDEIRKSFNAIVQGSVAEAVQSALIMFAHKGMDNIITETHDSMVIACKFEDVEKWVEHGSKIMNKPFRLMGDGTSLPVKISIGKTWGKWTECKVIR